jgi:hypothetical protein
VTVHPTRSKIDLRSIPRDPPRRIPGQPYQDRSAILVRIRPDAAAERSIRRTLDPLAESDELPFDALLSRVPDLRGRPLFARVPPGESVRRAVQWVLPGDHWSPTPGSDATNVLMVPPRMDAEAVRRQVAADPRVALAEFPPVRYPATLPGADDTLADQQWGLQVARFPEVWKKLEAPSSPRVPVAVIDSGCIPHPDIEQPIKYETYGASTADLEDHGTGVCGVLAARRNNGYGVAGAAMCALHIYKVIDHGWSWAAYLQALKDVERSGVKFLNISLTGPSANETERTLIKECVRAGVAVVAAMGNEGPGSPPLYPAAYYPEVIAVGATEWDNGGERVAGFSSWGDHIWVVAPGTAIPSTSTGPTGYRMKDGTSFSAPLVTAACVHLSRWRPELDPDGIRKWIANLTVPVKGSQGWGRATGYGRLDLRRLGM